LAREIFRVFGQIFAPHLGEDEGHDAAGHDAQGLDGQLDLFVGDRIAAELGLGELDQAVLDAGQNIGRIMKIGGDGGVLNHSNGYDR